MGSDDGRGSYCTKTKIISAVCLLSILLAVIVSVVVRLNDYSEEFEDKKIAVAKTVLGQLSVSPIQTSDKDKFTNYKGNFVKETNWGDDDYKLSQLCDFANLLLKYYNEKPDKESKEYLKFADDIIRKINAEIFERKNFSIIAKSNDYSLLCSLTKLLNAFEYFADDSYGGTKILCHNQILQILPEFNKLYLEGIPEPNIGGNLKDVESIYIITARLLTNVISDRELYNFDIEKRNAIEVLKNQFDNLANNPEKTKKFNSYPYYYNMYEVLRSGY